MRHRLVGVLRCGALGAAVIGLAACGSAPKPTTIVNKDDGWSYPLPAEFKRTDLKMPTGYLQFATPFVNKKRITLTITSGLDSHTAAEDGQDLVKNPPDGLAIQSSGPFSVGGGDGYTVVGTSDEGKQTQRQVIIKGKSVMVTMTLTVETSEFDKWDQTLQESLKGFRWTD